MLRRHHVEDQAADGTRTADADVVVLPDPVDSTILIVDDQEPNVALLRRILGTAGYQRIEAETDPRRIAERFDAQRPDVILLDLQMPHLDGFAVLELLRPKLGASYLPVIVLTADATPEARLRALAAGATDFLTKPFDINEVILRVRNVVETQRLYRQLERFNAGLEVRVLERTRELEQAYLDTVDRLAAAAELRDDATGEHLLRVGRTSGLIAARLGLSSAEVETIARAATLHDIGKIGVPDAILLKPGRLSPLEFEQVKTHTTIGAAILAGPTSALLRAAEDIARFHHERWDGQGYAGIAGTRIPLRARIVSVADAYDAMTSDRPYKDAIEPEWALEEIGAGAGSQFDPMIADAFLSLDPSDLRTSGDVDPSTLAS